MTRPSPARRSSPSGFGAAPIGNLYRAVDDDAAHARRSRRRGMAASATSTPPRTTGSGSSERRLGAFLRDKPREEYVVSTKVGRLLEPNPDFAGGRRPRRRLRRADDARAPLRSDRSRACAAALEDSLERLGLDRIDIALPARPRRLRPRRGLREGLPALAALRDEGLVDGDRHRRQRLGRRPRAVREGDLDVVMIAGRYTLLEQPAADDLLPACAERGVRSRRRRALQLRPARDRDPGAGAHYNYGDVPDDVLRRARGLARRVPRHRGVPAGRRPPVPAAPPRGRTVVVGSARATSVRENLERAATNVPEPVWAALRDEGLIP